MTPNESLAPPVPEEALNGVLANLLDALTSGKPVDLSAWQARYPAFAGELAELIAAREEVSDALQVSFLVHGQEGAEASGGKALLGTLGDYELLEELGAGGMGRVYRARQRSLGRLVALKVIRTGAIATEADQLRFHTEAEATARLDHPNIVPVYEIGEHDGLQFIAGRYIEGTPLSGHLNHFRDDPQAAAALVAVLARALQHAHQRGVLHRDLKPGNVLLEWPGGAAKVPVPYVTDFGLARLLDQDSNLTRSGDLVGTPSYMAPEQASGGTAAITTATDIYGLGAILYALLTCQPPFSGHTILETLEQVKGCEPERPRRLNPKVDRDLETICLTCLAKDHRRRYTSALALAEDLESWLANRPIAARPATARERLAKWIRRHPATAAFAGLSAFVALAVLGGSLWYGQVLREALLDSDRLRHEGLAREANLRDLVYVADMRLAKDAWDTGDLPHLAELLERQGPARGEADRRGFEWHWLKGCLGIHLGTLKTHDGGLLCAAVSPNDRFLVTADRKGAVKVWDLASRQPVCTLPGHTGEVQRAVFSPDGGTLATCGKDETVKLWDVATWSERACLRGGDCWTITSVAFSPDGKVLASCSRNRRIVLWELPGGRIGRSWLAHDDVVSDIVFMPDGRTLVSLGKEGGHLKFWDVATGAEKVERRLYGCPPDLVSLALSPDGKVIAAGGYSDAVWLWSTAEPAAAPTRLAVPPVVRSLAFARSGTQLVATGGSGMFRVWRLDGDGREARPGRSIRWDGGNGRAVVLARNDSLLITASEEDGAVEFWDPARLDGWESLSPLPPRVPIPTDLMDVALSPDGRGASVHWRGQVAVLDLSKRWVQWSRLSPPGSHALLSANQKWTSGPTAVAFSPDGQTMAVGSADHQTRVWNVESAKQILMLEHGARVRAVAFSPSGALIATVGDDHTARLWEFPSGAPRAALASQSGSDLTLAFSSDGRTLAVAGQDRAFGVSLWDVGTGQRRSRLSDSDSAAARVRSAPAAGRYVEATVAVRAVAFSPDDSALATGCSDGIIRLWDVASGDIRQTLSGHVASVCRMAFAPDGLSLASLGEDNVVNLWHLKTGQRFFSMDSQKRELHGLAFSRDGRLLVTGARSPNKDAPSSLLMWGDWAGRR
jgi:WD40 repeat protein/tRNA A-37 threonylcarbamoyl transferase component Bud32